ncbi:MAG: Gfo/Idh/MocA family oxidoreductase [Verrucomicrobiales bacterium]|nr:Gfo/Idh/MocA family oxidoreductase [Verrucomicrobiales bacterium]
MKQLRIGFLSTAGIGRKNWRAIFNSGNCVVSAVASRDVNKSREFIRECQDENSFDILPDALGSYEALIASPEVDAVYIPLPTGLRKEWVLRAAAAGKHIICEKPCAVSAAELEEMISACAKHRVQFMDGVMFMHSPRMAKLREVLDDGQSVGEIRRIVSAFSFYGDGNFSRDNIRVNAALEPAGCLGDLGWYCIRFALWTMNWQLPREVTGKILLQSGTSAPTEFTGELIYDGGASSGFYCSFLAARQQWAHVCGQKGWLRVPGFVHALDSYEPAFEVNDAEIRTVSGVKCPPGVEPAWQGHATAQDTLMFRNFANQIFSGNLNEDWPQWALKTQKVLDACHEAARRGTSLKLGT